MDIEHLKTWIGRQESGEELLTPTLVQRFNATLERCSGSAPGDAAPSLIHLCLAQPIAPMSALGRDGHPALGGFLPPVPLPRRMWAGGAFEFIDEIRLGETVRRVSTIRDVTLKEGRSGPLCFVTVDHALTSDGREVLHEQQDIVYRAAEGAAPSTARPPSPAPPGAQTKVISPTATLLFRYSALTFNGHRIHYDKDFATGVEGYPGLVVHGPMQATMLCHYAADLRGTPPRQFRFRSLSPLFDDADFTLNAEETPDGVRLWTARDGGPLAMEAHAAW